MKKKTLIFFTNDFPFGEGEYFIEKEYPYLASKFDNILIITTSSKKHQTREVQKNTQLYKYPYHNNLFEKFLSFTIVVLMKPFYDELRIIKKANKQGISFFHIKQIAFALYKGIRIRSFIDYLIKKQNLGNSDIYLYSYWMDNMVLAIAMLKNKHPEYKCFCRAHGWDLYVERNIKEYLPLRNYMLKKIDAVYFISENGKEYLKNHYKNINIKAYVSKLGTMPIESIKKVRNTDFLSLLSVSAVIKIKRMNLLIEALSKISGIKINWVHIGSGENFENIKEYAQQLLACKENVSFEFKGEMKNKEVINYLSKNHIDILINVSSSEGIPVSIMEAMSFGIPVIATSVGGVSEIVNSENGTILNPDVDARTISKAIIDFYYLSIEEKESKSKQALKTWEEYFNASKNYIEFIESIFKL